MSTKFLMRNQGIVGYAEPPKAQWLAYNNVDAHDGRGHCEWTSNKARAIRFDDAKAALEEWRRQSTVRPLRPDGKPNRPLTAYTVTIERVDE